MWPDHTQIQASKVIFGFHSWHQVGKSIEGSIIKGALINAIDPAVCVKAKFYFCGDFFPLLTI